MTEIVTADSKNDIGVRKSRVSCVLTSPRGKSNMSYKDAALEVAKELLCKYYHNTVSCVSFPTIVTRVEGKKMLKEEKKIPRP